MIPSAAGKVFTTLQRAFFEGLAPIIEVIKRIYLVRAEEAHGLRSLLIDHCAGSDDELQGSTEIEAWEVLVADAPEFVVDLLAAMVERRRAPVTRAKW